MNNVDKLEKFMRPGKVYRRQELQGASTAVDRDLRTLVANGDVRKLSGGLYYRPRTNPFGVTPPDDRDLVRAFLKTDDFLLTSHNHFNGLGLGLTQVYNGHVVYNHKRSGNFSLGGKNFKFRMVPSFPNELSREFLLVDLLNNLKHLPDNTDLVRQNLKVRLNEFDQNSVNNNLEKYGRSFARAVLREVHA